MKSARAAALIAGVLGLCALVGGIAATIIDSVIHRHRA